MIKNAIFDIGNVLVKVDFNGAFKRLTGADDKTVQRYRHAFFDEGTWDEVDRGVLSDEELVDSFIKKEPELEEGIRRIWENLNEVIRQYDFSITWINSLKERGINTYYLSNWSHHLKDVGRNEMTFIPCFDGGMYSCDVNLLKPDSRIYEALLQKYDLKAYECVFLDDSEKNVKGALNIGMEAILVKDQKTAFEELEKLIQQERIEHGH